MKYNQPFGISDPNAQYINGNPSTGTMGSIPPAASIEYPQREIANFITDAGITPDNADLHQVAKSVQRGAVIYSADTGIQNALAINLTPPLIAFVDGMHIWVKLKFSNSGPATIQVNSLSGKNIVRRGGGLLQAGDMPANYMSLLVYNSTNSNFELYSVNFAPPSLSAPALSADTNLYVNVATGDDTTMDGSAPVVSGPHGPFKTITRAMNETFKYGPSVYTMTINVASGTYAEAVNTPSVIGPRVWIKGNGYQSTLVTGAYSLHTFHVSNGNTMLVTDLYASANQGGGGPPACFEASSGGTMFPSNTGTGIASSYIYQAYGGYMYPGHNHFASGSSCAGIFCALYGGFLSFQPNHNFTFDGPFILGAGGATAMAGVNGSIGCGAPYLPNFYNPLNVSGYRYLAYLNGVVNTQNAGLSFFPGTLAGVTDKGGWYV